MKKILCITIFCLCSVAVFAQQIEKKNQFEVSLAISGSTGDRSIVGVNPMIIYDHVIDDWGVGLGSGFLFSTTDRMGGDDFYRSIPIVIDMRWMPKLVDAVSFVGVFNVGGLVHLGDTDEIMGHYLSPQAGFRFRVAKGWSVNIRALYANFYTIENFSTFGVAIGVSF